MPTCGHVRTSAVRATAEYATRFGLIQCPVPFGTDCTLTLASTGRSGTVGYQSGWEGVNTDGHSPCSHQEAPHCAAQRRCYLCPLGSLQPLRLRGRPCCRRTNGSLGMASWCDPPSPCFPTPRDILGMRHNVCNMQDARRFSYRRRSTLSLHRHLRAVAEAVPVRIPSPRVVVFRTVRHHSQGRKGIPYDVFLGTGRRYGQSRPARARQGTARCG